MRKYLILGIILSFAWIATNCDAKEHGNGTIVTKNMDITSFHSIVISEKIQKKNSFFSRGKNYMFTYEQQDSGNPSLQLSIDENLYPFLDIAIEDSTLYIRTKDETEIKPSQFLIKGTSEDLKKVAINGIMNFYSGKSMHVENVTFSVSGVADIIINNLTCKNLGCNISGVGDIILKGNVENGNYHLSGVGRIKAFDCMVENLECHLSGVGSMQITASKQLDAHTSGVGSMRYKGDASVSKHSSGIGRIKKVD